MNLRYSVAAAAMVAAVALNYVPAGAQGGRGGAPKMYTPEKGARDMKAVLFSWGWHLGMLRGVSEPEIVTTLEYQGKGTIQVEGQPCTLTKYRVSTNYQTPGQRTQIECTRANGQKYTNIESVSDQFAWNEDIPGAEIVAGKGKATPMPAAVQERLIRLWASPQGALKAALAAAAGTQATEVGVNPATLLDRAAASGAKVGTTLEWPTITFPIPGVPGAVATATLDDGYLPSRVLVRQGGTTTEFIYGDYQDWNNPLNKIEALYAGRITEKRNGVVVRDLTTVETETGSVYVVVPVPASVRKAAGK